MQFFFPSIDYTHIYLYLIISNIKAALYFRVLFFFSSDGKTVACSLLWSPGEREATLPSSREHLGRPSE